MKEMLQKLGTIPQELEASVSKAGKEVTGPAIWVYNCPDGNIENEFILDVTLPVNEMFEPDDSRFVCKELPEFKCLIDYNKGPWNQVGKVYESMMKHARENGINIKHLSREVYQVCDFENQENCVTEVQLEIEA